MTTYLQLAVWSLRTRRTIPLLPHTSSRRGAQLNTWTIWTFTIEFPIFEAPLGSTFLLCRTRPPVDCKKLHRDVSATNRTCWNSKPTTRSRVPLENLTVAQLVKKFPVFYGTRRFIAVFTRASHWIVSWARWIQSTLSHPISFKIHFNIIFPSTRIGLFPLGFPTRSYISACISHLFHACYTPR
jgi:hypothetical protein